MNLENLTPAELIELINSQAEQIKTQEQTIIDLQSSATEKEAACVLHMQQIEKLNAIVGAVKSTATVADEKNGSKIPSETIEHEGEEYQWQKGSFYLPGDTTKYTAEMASNDSEILGKLLAINGQKILKKLA